MWQRVGLVSRHWSNSQVQLRLSPPPPPLPPAAPAHANLTAATLNQYTHISLTGSGAFLQKPFLNFLRLFVGGNKKRYSLRKQPRKSDVFTDNTKLQWQRAPPFTIRQRALLIIFPGKATLVRNRSFLFILGKRFDFELRGSFCGGEPEPIAVYCSEEKFCHVPIGFGVCCGFYI